MDLLAQYSNAQGKSNAVKGYLCKICFFSLLWKSLCELEIVAVLQS